MAMNKFSELPDDLITNIMSYWSPRNAKDFERIKKLMWIYQKGLGNPTNYIINIINNPDKCRMRIRYTKKCLFYVKSINDREHRIILTDVLSMYQFRDYICKNIYLECTQDILLKIQYNDKSFYKNTIIELYKADQDFWNYTNSGEWRHKYIIFQHFYDHIISGYDISMLYTHTIDSGSGSRFNAIHLP